MFRRLSLVAASAVAITTVAVAPAFAFANPGANGRAATAPGQVVASQKCFETIERQNANGQTRYSNTLGVQTAVTNCDHFWQYND